MTCALQHFQVKPSQSGDASQGEMTWRLMAHMKLGGPIQLFVGHGPDSMQEEQRITGWWHDTAKLVRKDRGEQWPLVWVPDASARVGSIVFVAAGGCFISVSGCGGE